MPANEHMKLMLPGPTPIPPSALLAQGRPMINHRGPEFKALFEDCLAGVKWLYETEGDVCLMAASSGTGGLEAAVANTLSTGDKVLAVVAGEFGKRFADMAETYGAVVTRIEVPYGEGLAPEALADALAKDDYFALLLTHNETSTSVMQPLEALAAAARRVKPELLILVDAVSSLGVVPLPVDAWDLDVVVSGSQKAFMIPPGMASCSVSKRAWAAVERSNLPKYYFSFKECKAFEGKGQTPWTPSISLFFALSESLKLMRAEGLAAIFERHETMARMLRAGAKALGLELVVKDEALASRSVTGIFPPAGINADAFRKALQDDFGLVLAGGQGKMAGRIVRVGHLGFYQPLDMLTVLAAMEVTLAKLGAKIELGAGVRAAQEAMLNRSAVPA